MSDDESRALVSEAIDKAYAAVPKAVVNRPSDEVAWRFIDEDGLEKIGGSACYNAVMNNVSKYEIHLRPYVKNSCHPVRLRAFLSFCQRAGLILPDAQIVIDQGQLGLVIPRGHQKHEVYMSLALYRHADIHARSLVIPTLELFRNLQQQGITFWQCLYYTMVRFAKTKTWINWSGHSFCDLNESPYNSKPGEPPASKWMNPGLAIALWAKLGAEGRKDLPTDHYLRVVVGTVASNMQVVPITNLQEILSPASKELFQEPEKLLKEPFPKGT